MEVTTIPQKKLHRHALPIAIVTLGLFGLAAVAQVQFKDGLGNTGGKIGRALVVRPVHFAPTSHGLAHITFGVDQADVSAPQADLADTAPKSHANLAETGRTAEVTIMLQGTH